MSSENGSDGSAEGNNNLSLANSKKRISSSLYWCFTYNNYIDGSLALLASTFDKFNMEYVIGREVGEEKGTPHLQGCVFSKVKFRPLEKFKGILPHMNWSKIRGSKVQNIAYCSKDGDYVANIPVPKPLYVPTLYGWQLDVLELVKDDCPPDCRKIVWCWEDEGGKGKSALARYLCIKKHALITSGRCADMKFSVVNFEKMTGCGPGIVVVDVPRSMENHFSYAGIEEVKNSVFCSSKFESVMYVGNPPHVIVLANFPPRLGFDLSADRFHIIDIAAWA